MGLINYMREKIRDFLQIEATNTSIAIQEHLDFYGNAIKNKIWYRGSGQELTQLYEQLDVPNTMFWKATATPGMEIRKIHTGLPKLMINSLTNIVVNDFNGVEIEDEKLSNYWNGIYKENKGNKLIKNCVKSAILIGDGAFKISFDKDISKNNPIIEYVSGENVEFLYKRGRIYEVVFVTKYDNKTRSYYFKEHYGFGYIKYELVNQDGAEVPLNSIKQTEWCDSKGVTFEKQIMLAVPVIYGESEQYKGRGESIFEGKIDAFDSLDEAWSQWMDALRAGRTKQYIPDSLLPRNPKTGEAMKPNSFDNRFIKIENNMSETGTNKIDVEQAQIPHESYLSTYITALDLCLQGVISPSTLGIDVKKLDNAEAQREKEKTTLYTRGNIIELLNDVIPELVTASIYGYQLWNKIEVENSSVTVKFGEYANPSFESQVETLGKAKSTGIMSIEASVDELYGDTKNNEWKEKEVSRIKNELGIINTNEPSAADDLTPLNVDTPTGSTTLNGAQIQSLMSVIGMIKEGKATRSEGIAIITSTLGINKETAETFIENNAGVTV